MIADGLYLLLWLVALIALMASVWTDLKDRIIPNEIVGLVMVCGLGLTLLLRPEQIGIGLLSAAALLIGLGVLAHLAVMGGGDVKLITAASLLFPPAYIGQMLVSIALAGGLLSCIYIAARRSIVSGARRQRSSSDIELSQTGLVPRWVSVERERIAAGGPMPYALAISGGVVSLIAGELSQCLPANFCSF